MPALLGTATASYRVGQAAVQKIYLGSSVVFDGTTTGTTTSGPPPADVDGIPTPAGLQTSATAGTYFFLKWNLYGDNRAYVTSHVFQRSVDEGATWTDFTITPTITFSAPGLNPAQAQPYTARFAFADFPSGLCRLRVAARSGVWQGAWSEPSPYLIKLEAPTAPTGLTVSAGGTPPRVNLSWSASTGSAGAGIEYLVEATTSNGTVWTVVSVESGTSTRLGDPDRWYSSPSEVFTPSSGPSTSSGIRPGIAYKFRVYATYARTPLVRSVYGSTPPLSTPTATSAEVTAPATEPGRVWLGVDAVYSGGAKLALGASDGGSPITRFDIYVSSTVGSWGSPIAYNSPTPESLASGSSRSAYYLTGLTNGTVYWVRAVAVNAIGTGVAMGVSFTDPNNRAINFQPADTISPVLNLSASALNAGVKYSYAGGVTYEYPSDKRAVSLSWTDAPYATYTPIFQISSTLRAINGTTTTGTRVYEDWVDVSHTPASRMSNKAGNTVDNLLPNSTYEFRVREVKGLEYGPWKYTGFVLTAS